MTRPALPILNLAEARFECTFGRGCDGICCRNGRPPLYMEEVALIQATLPRLLQLLRPAARAVVERSGFISRRGKPDRPLARVVDGWCVFFNQGCTLHMAGEAEGDSFRYKPLLCSLFPLTRDRHARWYVRQRGLKRERWNLFCIDAHPRRPPAAEHLHNEIALAQRITDAEEAEELRVGGV